MSIYSQLFESEAGKKALAQEELILHVCERIYDLMSRQGMSKTELARKLKVSKGRVSNILSGQANITLRTLADLGVALDAPVRVDIGNHIHEKIEQLSEAVDAMIQERAAQKAALEREQQKSRKAVLAKFNYPSGCNDTVYSLSREFQVA